MVRRQGAFLHRDIEIGVKGGGDLLGVGLPWGGGVEAGGNGTPQGEEVRQAVTGGDLAVDGVAKIGKILVARRELHQQVVSQLRLQFAVHRVVVPGPGAGVFRGEALEAAGAGP